MIDILKSSLKLLREISRACRELDRTDPNVRKIIHATERVEKLIIRAISRAED